MRQRQQAAAEALAQLPPPSAAAQAQSEQLIELILTEMAANGGRLSFARYMELALYAPGLGYYSGGSQKFGTAGDFVTAPEISPLFSRCLARQVADILRGLGGGEVLEVGAGSGVMAAEVLAELAALDMVPERYLILELSGELRARQREAIAARVPYLLERVQWLDALPAAGLHGAVLANELLDALPVHCFRVTAEGVKERFVTWNGERFQWALDAPRDAHLVARLADIAKDLPVGYESELSLAAEGWVAAIAGMLGAGVVLLVDYGFPRHEYYHPERAGGTLMCHYRHRAHDDPFVYPGLQDITAHVDFTAVAEAAHAAGLQVAGYNTQGFFLLANGLTEMTPPPADERQQLLLAQQIRTLTLPSEMGELFKVMALSRHYDEALGGFALQDLRSRL
jgi:SAM-dependent MidA family methyltransferase